MNLPMNSATSSSKIPDPTNPAQRAKTFFRAALAGIAIEPIATAERHPNLVTHIKCRTPNEANLFIAELAKADILAFVTSEVSREDAESDPNTPSPIRVQVSTRAFESAKGLRCSLESPVSPQLLPLPWPARCAALCLPLFTLSGVVMFGLLRTLYRRRGNDRRSKELARWFVAGVVFWTMVFLAFALARQLQG